MMVIWLMGISGVGKTTLGNKLKEYLDNLNKKSFIIEGGAVRTFFDNELGYSKEDRKANVKRTILSAYTVSQNGIVAIVCNISPFEELREFARRKIGNYNEIWLKRDLELCKKVKKMYQKNVGKTEIVGIDLEFDEPKNSDLTVHTGEETVEESFRKIVNYLKNKYPEEF